MLRVVADVGNTRLKWGRLDGDCRLAESLTLPLDDPSAWEAAWRRWEPSGVAATAWAIASVNPPAAARMSAFIDGLPASNEGATWYRSAADVPVRHSLQKPETAGADRALAVSAAVADGLEGRPCLLVMCGTAVTVECINVDGTWRGGAIAAGLSLTARALHMLTAQLPLVEPRDEPAPWGDATRSALEAGVFWGVVGAISELLRRQSLALGHERPPRVVWTGGDAPRLARAVAWPGARVVPDLVLRGLASVAFGGGQA